MTKSFSVNQTTSIVILFRIQTEVQFTKSIRQSPHPKSSQSLTKTIRRVEEVIKKKKLNQDSLEMYIKTLFIFVSWFVLYYLTMIKGNFWAAPFFGLIHRYFFHFSKTTTFPRIFIFPFSEISFQFLFPEFSSKFLGIVIWESQFPMMVAMDLTQRNLGLHIWLDLH